MAEHTVNDNITAEQLTTAALADPQLRAQLFEEYGVVIAASPTGDGFTIAEVRSPGKLKKALAEGLVDGRESAKTTGHKVGTKVAMGAAKTSEVLGYALLSAPVEGAKTVKSKARERKLNAKANHARRVADAKARKARRAEAKAAREAAEQAAAEQVNTEA